MDSEIFAYDDNGFPLGLKIGAIANPVPDDCYLNDGRVCWADSFMAKKYPILEIDNPYNVWNLRDYAMEMCPDGFHLPKNFFRCANVQDTYVSNTYNAVLVCKTYTTYPVIVFEKNKTNRIEIVIDNALPETEGIEDVRVSIIGHNNKTYEYKAKAKHTKV